MISVHTLCYAVLAERVSAFGDMRILVSIAANHTLGESLHDLFNTDFELLIVSAFCFAKNWLNDLFLVLRVVNTVLRVDFVYYCVYHY